MKEFHESYFVHRCLIIPERDVLDTDIIGSGWLQHLKWWWNDLFLLSYSNESSRGFYTSTHAMKIERFRQFRKYRGRIHPMSKFRTFWNFLILHVLILNKLLFRLTSTFLYDELSMNFFYLGAVLDLIIIFDLFISFKTGYIDYEAKQVILDTKKCLLKFCTQKLFIHFASAMPMHWFLFMRYGTKVTCGLCKFNHFICALKILSIFPLFRIFEASAYWTRKRHTTRKIYFYKFLRIAATGLITVLQFAEVFDAISLIVFMKIDIVDPRATIAGKITIVYSGKAVIQHRQGNAILLFVEAYRILNVFCMFSFGRKTKYFYLDKLAFVAAFAISHIFYIWNLLTCYALVSSFLYSKDQEIKVRSNTLNYIRSQRLSENLSKKVDRYFRLKRTRMVIAEKQNELYRSLPLLCKNEIKMSCYMTLLMRLPLFSDWSLSIIQELVLVVEEIVYLANDVVSSAGVEGEGLMIVDTGILAVYSENHEEKGHLIDGDYFGELSLVTDRELCMSSVVAVTDCVIFLLHKIPFRNVLKSYPKEFHNLKTEVKNTHDKTTKVRLSLVPHVST
ncbi:unnamed protein product [Chrysodeixis includens]|uniref:Cyclic nucleotide-binding domain-containing protein n=1 Tax=Chrysodeixis includens TaxID=689277 RepID=A0A9P0BJR9_CHRIL|nr:unnamed protein product [Chrysodeixis includens]